MNVEPTQQPTTDDPELAKVLAGNDDQNQQAADNSTQSGLQFEETPISTDASGTSNLDVAAPIDDAGIANAIDQLSQVTPEPTMPEPAVSPTPAVMPTATSELENIKKDALGELRPLVDKLSLPADEKFDIMLLIIRSTDDQSLVGAAHAAAKGIEDETKRAQALLDIVKEIDYFAAQQQAT